MGTKKTAWLRLNGPVDNDELDDLSIRYWFDTENGGDILCNNFWPHYDWVPPKANEEMRLIFSTEYVLDAQRSELRCEGEWSISTLSMIHPLNVGVDARRLSFLWIMDRLFDDLFNVETDEPDLKEAYRFSVWWWPEYREGGK